MKDTTRKAVIGKMALNSFFGNKMDLIAFDEAEILSEIKPSRTITVGDDKDRVKRNKKESRWDNDD